MSFRTIAVIGASGVSVRVGTASSTLSALQNDNSTAVTSSTIDQVEPGG